MNYRLQTLPYRKIISNIDYKAYERGSNVIEADAKRSLITCSPCRSVDKRNRVDSKYKCKKRGFSLNLHYVACLNLFSHLNDGEIAIRGGKMYLTLKAGSVVSANLALNDSAMSERVLEGKPVLNIINSSNH
ncbi:MAG: zinc ribbon domain-containing protein [Acidilobaceae archaeon]